MNNHRDEWGRERASLSAMISGCLPKLGGITAPISFKMCFYGLWDLTSFDSVAVVGVSGVSSLLVITSRNRKTAWVRCCSAKTMKTQFGQRMDSV